MKHIRHEIEALNKMKRCFLFEEKLRQMRPEPILHRSLKLISFMLLHEIELCDRQLISEEVNALNERWLFKK